MSAVQQPIPVQAPPVVRPAPPPPQPVQPARKGGAWKWLVLLAVIGIGSWAIYQSMTGKQQPAPAVVAVRTAPVAIGTVEKVLRISGQTSAREFSNVTAPLMRGPDSNREMILIHLAKSGGVVKKGELIAQIDAQSMQDHVDDLKDTIEAAEADISKRAAEQSIEWETLQQTLKVAKSELDKAKLDNGAAEVKTDIEQQLLKLALDEADARYKQLQADLAQKKASHTAELRILELTKERHTRHRNRHLNDITRFTIHAGMNGLAVMSPIWRGSEMGQIQMGDQVRPGQPFMKVVDVKSMQVEGTVNQAESGGIRIGQPARIKFDAFPGLELKGKVYSMGALASGGWRQNNYIRTIPVRVAIEGADPRLIPDLSASADVVLDRAENKVVAPIAAVRNENGKTLAYVKKGETFEAREIKLGLQNENLAVVLSGLDSGDEVRLN